MTDPKQTALARSLRGEKDLLGEKNFGRTPETIEPLETPGDGPGLKSHPVAKADGKADPKVSNRASQASKEVVEKGEKKHAHELALTPAPSFKPAPSAAPAPKPMGPG